MTKKTLNNIPTTTDTYHIPNYIIYYVKIYDSWLCFRDDSQDFPSFP